MLISSLPIQTFRRPTSRPPPVRTTSAPQYQRRTPSMVWNMYDGCVPFSSCFPPDGHLLLRSNHQTIIHVPATHAFGFFPISCTLRRILASSQTCLRCHLPCSFHPHLWPFPCSVASLRAFRSGYWSFLKMLFFCVGISLFFHLLDGGFFSFSILLLPTA